MVYDSEPAIEKKNILEVIVGGESRGYGVGFQMTPKTSREHTVYVLVKVRDSEIPIVGR